MATQGIHSLTADEAACLMTKRLGFDEVDFTEQLTNGTTVVDAEWDATNDLNTSDGVEEITVTDEQDATIAAFVAGELKDAFNLIPSVADRKITAGFHWHNHGLNTFEVVGEKLKLYGIGYAGLHAEYAPMTPGLDYNLAMEGGAEFINGDWYVQDDSGNAIGIITSQNAGTDISFNFTAAGGTSGGLRVGSGNGTLWYADNFNLSLQGGGVTVGLVFEVQGTGDTTDDGLENAKGSAPVSGDLFAVTNITGGEEEVVYIGNAVGSYAWSAISTTSTLIQTASNRASAGVNAKGRDSKEYTLTYAIAEVNQRARNISSCANDNYDTFTGESATGFQVIGNGTGTQKCGTADEIVVKDGKTYTVSFTLALTSGALPIVNMLKALAGSALADETDTATVEGSNTLTFTASSADTGVIQFSNEDATAYTVSSLKVFENTFMPDGDFALTLTTSYASESITMPFTVGSHTVYFKSASAASTGDFTIQSVSAADTTEGVFSITSMVLRRCCDNGVAAEAEAWFQVRAYAGNATFACTAITGDNATSKELSEDSVLEGLFSRITGTSGIIQAFRTSYR